MSLPYGYTEQELYCVIVLSVCVADDEMHDDELDYIEFLIGHHAFFKGLPDGSLNTAWTKFIKLVNEHSLQSVLAECARAVQPFHRPMVFALCVEAMYADARLEAPELEHIENLKRLLRIQDHIAQTIQMAISWRNGFHLEEAK